MKARDIMTSDVVIVGGDETIQDAAQKMEQADTGALPVCGPDRRLQGMVTDRDITIRGVARGLDPSSATVNEVLTPAEVVTIGADDSVEEARRTMKDHAVRRLPVIDGQEVVGIISQGDIAHHLSETKTGDLVEAISEAP